MEVEMLQEGHAELDQQLDVNAQEPILIKRNALNGGIVGTDRGKIVVTDERDRIQVDPWLLVGRFLADLKGREQIEPAGTDQQNVAGAHFGALSRPARFEEIAADGLAWGQPVHPEAG